MNVKRRITLAARLIIAALALPLLPGLYFSSLKGPSLESSVANPRNVPRPELRGRILDRAGRPLAYSKGRRRIYPLGSAAAPLIGYFDLRLGTAGAEHLYDQTLKGRENPRDLDDTLKVTEEGLRGRDVVLTLDAELQRYAYGLLNGRRGAVVLLHVPTGDPLVLVSSPSYDPKTVGEIWDDLQRDTRSPLLNRAVAGVYPPGSTFKILTALAVLSESLFSPGHWFRCDGGYTIGGYTIGDYTIHDSSGEAHGALTLSDAIVVSCNVTFAGLGRKLGLAKTAVWMKKTGLLERLAGVPDAEGGAAPLQDAGAAGAAQAGFGQGSVLVTPLGMARLTALVARGGEDLEPVLRRADLVNKKTRDQEKPNRPVRVVDAKRTIYVKKAMRGVVERGTGTAAALKGFEVCGKTGTAENAQGKNHAWFIGFAPYQKPLFAVSVIVENAGYGGVHAAPIARKLLAKALASRLGPSGSAKKLR